MYQDSSFRLLCSVNSVVPESECPSSFIPLWILQPWDYKKAKWKFPILPWPPHLPLYFALLNIVHRIQGYNILVCVLKFGESSIVKTFASSHDNCRRLPSFLN